MDVATYIIISPVAHFVLDLMDSDYYNFYYSDSLIFLFLPTLIALFFLNYYFFDYLKNQRNY